MHADLESIVCKFGGNPAICMREEVIWAKVYRQTDRRTDDGRRAIALAHSWNELIIIMHPRRRRLYLRYVTIKLGIQQIVRQFFTFLLGQILHSLSSGSSHKPKYTSYSVHASTTTTTTFSFVHLVFPGLVWSSGKMFGIATATFTSSLPFCNPDNSNKALKEI